METVLENETMEKNDMKQNINWDELTLGASEPMYHGWGNGDYRSRLEIKVLVNGEVKVLSQAKLNLG